MIRRGLFYKQLVHFEPISSKKQSKKKFRIEVQGLSWIALESIAAFAGATTALLLIDRCKRTKPQPSGSSSSLSLESAEEAMSTPEDSFDVAMQNGCSSEGLRTLATTCRKSSGLFDAPSKDLSCPSLNKTSSSSMKFPQIFQQTFKPSRKMNVADEICSTLLPFPSKVPAISHIPSISISIERSSSRSSIDTSDDHSPHQSPYAASIKSAFSFNSESSSLGGETSLAAVSKEHSCRASCQEKQEKLKESELDDECVCFTRDLAERLLVEDREHSFTMAMHLHSLSTRDGQKPTGSDVKQIMDLLDFAASLGHCTAALNLGILVEKRGNKMRALQLFKQAGHEGSSRACFRAAMILLADVVDTSCSCQKLFNEAVDWLARSCAGRFDLAILVLSKLELDHSLQ